MGDLKYVTKVLVIVIKGTIRSHKSLPLLIIPRPFGNLAPPNMSDTIIISVGEQVKRWQRVMLPAPVYSPLVVRTLRP